MRINASDAVYPHGGTIFEVPKGRCDSLLFTTVLRALGVTGDVSKHLAYLGSRQAGKVSLSSLIADLRLRSITVDSVLTAFGVGAYEVHDGLDLPYVWFLDMFNPNNVDCGLLNWRFDCDYLFLVLDDTFRPYSLLGDDRPKNVVLSRYHKMIEQVRVIYGLLQPTFVFGSAHHHIASYCEFASRHPAFPGFREWLWEWAVYSENDRMYHLAKTGVLAGIEGDASHMNPLLGVWSEEMDRHSALVYSVEYDSDVSRFLSELTGYKSLYEPFGKEW